MTKNGSNGGKTDVTALRDDIKQTRAELGETVQALAAKVDVKARAKESVEHTKQRVRAQAALASDRLRGTALRTTDKVRESGALDKVHQTGERVKHNPIPLAAVIAAGAAIVVALLVIRGRRR